MDDILLTSRLRAEGFNSDDLQRLERSGELTRLRRGAYIRGPQTDRAAEEQHRLLIRATAPQLEAGAVLSHGSAAILYGLPVWPGAHQRVHVTRDRSGGGKARRLVHVHGAPLGVDEVVNLDGIPTTSLSRTVLDLCRTLPYEQAVAAGDRSLSLGLTQHHLLARADELLRWPGIRSARRAIAFLDGRSESAGESVSRVRLHEDEVPPPQLQIDLFDSDGRFVARPDFLWKQQRTVGEFDGKIKYGRLLKPGQRIEDVIFAEKVREDLLRDLGWQVVRWLWADLYRPNVIRDRVRRAFARGHTTPRP